MIYVMCIISYTSAQRIVEVLDEVPNITNGKKNIKNVINGDIEFKNVSFSYNNNEDKLCLNNINLKINSGEVIGIIGSTGSGKSTLISLINRLYDVYSGEVLVSGINVKDYNLKALRDNVSVVLQKNVLFSGTVIDNMRWGKADVTIEEIKKVCSLSCAKDFVEKHPEGYNYELGQGGSNVSGGQLQRLCIARSLLKNPKILILDDSTSAVDTETDALIRKNLSKLMQGATKIIIAQRIASVEDADRIIVMDKGKIVDFDTPSNLLKNNKIYKEIYESQKKGVIDNA